MPISLFIAEDDPLLQAFLATILGTEADFKVVGYTTNGGDVIPAVERLQPQLLLLDVHLGGTSGLKLLERLGQLENPPSVLMLSADDAEDTQLEAARNGAAGFLSKSEAAAKLGDAIRAVAAGQLWFHRRVVDNIFREHHRLLRQVRDAGKPANQLTDREREVLVCVARGMTNPQIASELYMSVHTVKLHIQNILRKLNLPNRTEAAVFAVREGLMEGHGGDEPSRA